jgi:hypothetical protein
MLAPEAELADLKAAEIVGELLRSVPTPRPVARRR